ncbi:Serine/threonine-protein kinase haspin [Araneus ventricosus]|uniref:Serine/threonine-protein kinase haspin n=1 Tax=Araneus ventricosus TaxID=182803 RepID=A0A4Y2CNC4_ARAVE|nr:Serine/threonine-protein kinase haspin [Araneus ventricosus]
MNLSAPILNIPLPVIAGALAGAAGQFAIHLHKIRGFYIFSRRLVRKWSSMEKGGTEAGIRSEVKRRNILRAARIIKASQMLRTFVPQRPSIASTIPEPEVQGSDVFEPEKFHHEASEKEQEEMQRKNLTQDLQHFSGPIKLDSDLEKVFEFCRVKNNVKFSDAISFWKQKTAKKIAEGSYGEIYKFEHIDGTERVFKCIPIDGQHAMNSYENISLSVAVPDIVASKLLSDLSEGSNCAAPNFPIIYNISLVRDRFPDLLMRAWWNYKNSPERLRDPAEHPPPDQYPESQSYLTIESSFCGEPLSMKHLQNAWVGVTIMSQIVSALAAAEAAYNFEHRDLHLANILVQDTPAESLKYTIHNQHFSILTVGCHVSIIDFTLSRIYNDKNVYCIGLDDIARGSGDRENARDNVWLNHKTMYQIMGECSKGNRWDKFMPATNIIWLKYMNENILDYLRKNNPENESQMKAFRLLREWNECILGHMSAGDLLQDVISKDNPIMSVHK